MFKITLTNRVILGNSTFSSQAVRQYVGNLMRPWIPAFAGMTSEKCGLNPRIYKRILFETR
jgi:hypothetical protein